MRLVLVQKWHLQGEKEKKFPLKRLLRTEFTPNVALLIAEFTLFPLATVFLIAKIPRSPRQGALLIAEFTLFPSIWPS
jgi:hypothetical protein